MAHFPTDRLASLHLYWYHEMFRLRQPKCKLPRGTVGVQFLRLDAAASICMLAAAEFPQLQGTVLTKLSKLIVEAPLPNPTEWWRGQESIHAGTHFLPSPFPPLISRLSLCGLTGRSSPVNLIYPLFRLCLPPASHIFSTWQNLNLSADGAHSCFLWPVSGGTGRRRVDGSGGDLFILALRPSDAAGKGTTIEPVKVFYNDRLTGCPVSDKHWWKIDLTSAFRLTLQNIFCAPGLNNKPSVAAEHVFCGSLSVDATVIYD